MKLFIVNHKKLAKLIAVKPMVGYATINEKIDGYQIKERDFGSIRQMFSQDYQQLNIVGDEREVAYSGAEHVDLPDITVIPNWRTREKLVVLGSTMGHYHKSCSQKGPNFLELYEIAEGFGAIVLDSQNNNEITMVLAKEGEKILIPNWCAMTIFNLGHNALITIDFASADQHCSDKDIQKRSGPILMIWRDAANFRLKLNSSYINRKDGFGVTLAQEHPNLEVKIPTDSDMCWGESLYESLILDDIVTSLKTLGIRVMKAEELDIASALGLPSYIVQKPLAEFRKTRQSPLRKYFFGS